MSFKRLDPEDISISAESVVAPLWSTDSVKLESFFTSSAQVASNTGDFYYTVHNQNINSPAFVETARAQFSIAFGNKDGLGAAPYNSLVVNKTPTSTIYGQYRNLVFGDEDTEFVFGTVASDSIYIINLDRARYKEKLFPGTFELTLKNGDDEIYLTDSSNQDTTVSFVDAGRVINIISGSAGLPYNQSTGGNGFSPNNGSYGKFLPDVGIIILNAIALDAPSGNGGISLATATDTTGLENNPAKLFDAIEEGESFKLQSEETISSNFIFVRVRNSEFNYSSNPSFITGSGELTHDIMINTPQSYITTVGMYNDNNDLLGVAKLSRPLLKDFTKEALIRIKLDY